ncbi:MAG: thioredoxin domain-containing protein [Acidimicrobiales bacterium]
MERAVVAGVVVVLAAVVALVAERRRPDAPTQARWAVPTQLDRADFERPHAPWLVALFTSATCHSCATATEKARVLASEEVAVDEVEIGARPDLHRRYHVEAVPTIVVADDEGVVRASFVGPPSATDLWAAVAEARAPGSSPEPDLGRPGP